MPDFRGSRGFRAAFALLVAVAVPSKIPAQRPPLGPLSSEEGAPVHRLSLVPVFERADIIARDELSTDLWVGFSNIFEQDSSATHVLFLDTERLLTAMTLRWGASARLEVGARVTLETTGPGFLDSFVLWYHDALHLGQANRDRFPSDAYAQQLADGDTTPFLDIPRRTLALQDVQAFAKWQAATSVDGRRALSLRGTVRVPAQSDGVGTDAAVVALARTAAGAWWLHGLLGVSTVRASRGLDPYLADRVFFFGVAAERSLGSSLAAVAQYQLASPILRGFDHRELDWPSSNLVLGLAGRWGRGWSWDLSFQEDVPPDTPAIDFTLGARISRGWGPAL